MLECRNALYCNDELDSLKKHGCPVGGVEDGKVEKIGAQTNTARATARLG